ncbi:putative secreted protein [Xanthomonas bromi]|nr:putative secreted protein [Xanthomonas bromi]
MPIFNQAIKATFFLTLLVSSSHAAAACGVVAHIEGSISGWPTRVANSSNDRLRTA